MNRLTGDGRNQLHNMLDANFDNEELKTLCFNLNIDWDNLRGEMKQAKVRELILRCERTGSLNLLRVECERQRPSLDWSTSFRLSGEPQHQLVRALGQHTLNPLIVLALAAAGIVAVLAISRILIQTPDSTAASSPTTPPPQGNVSNTMGEPATNACVIKWFFQANSGAVNGLCPENPSSNRGINQQDFQRGKMMNFTGDTSVWVIIGTNNRTWEWLPYEDTWMPGQREPESTTQPPNGLLLPRERFGKVWHEQGLINTLGWATSECALILEHGSLAAKVCGSFEVKEVFCIVAQEVVAAEFARFTSRPRIECWCEEDLHWCVPVLVVHTVLLNS